jgi:dephospho-CoA kinase
MNHNLIAFTGYGRAGKDEAAKTLIAAGYKRCAFGDIVKRQLDPLVQRHFGFSAFTENTQEKAQIRRTLEAWAEDNYETVRREFFRNLPSKAVNTRLCRLREAEEWVSRGGIIVEVRRPGLRAETTWAGEQLADLREHRMIQCVVSNDGTVEELHAKIRKLFQLQEPPPIVGGRTVHGDYSAPSALSLN